MSSTKEKIIKAAIALFNEKGYVNVKMRDIANALEISPGNLTYHFPKKEILLETIHEEIIAVRNELLANVQLIPSIVNIHQQLIPLLESYSRYRFFYIDILEITRAYPEVAKDHRSHIRKQTDYIKAILDYSVGSGNMKAEMRPGQHEQLAHTVWMLLSFWLTQQQIRGEEGNFYDEARKAMWNLVLPLLTEKGQANFNKIYENEAIA